MTEPDLEAARRVAPILLLDRAEPFRPVHIGVKVFTAPGPSPSSKFAVTPWGTTCYEFAIFWDYDIGHLYDLEHIWVHVAGDTVLAVEATFHGQRQDVALTLQGGRPLVWCEAGKHAHIRDRAQRDHMFEVTRHMCGPAAGQGGVHVGNPFSLEFGLPSASDHRLAELFLKRRQFVPAGGDPIAFDLTDLPLTPWDQMPAMIITRMKQLIEGLCTRVAHLPALFLDCGDTLVDEGTEEKRPDGRDVVIRADLIPGATETVQTLRDLGYPLCLVADGPRETFENVLKPAGLWELFDAHVISGDIGVRKPDVRMFEAARSAMGLSSDQAARVPMVGNNLDRDIVGANRAGHPSFFFNWSDRRRRTPKGPDDTPTHQFAALQDLPVLVQAFEFFLKPDE